MTVDRLRADMSNDEFVRWSVFYQRKAQREEQALNEAKRRR